MTPVGEKERRTLLVRSKPDRSSDIQVRENAVGSRKISQGVDPVSQTVHLVTAESRLDLDTAPKGV